MLKRLLRQTEFKQLTTLVSPAFFDVMPSRLLFGEGRRLLSNYRDNQGFQRATSARRDCIAQHGLDVELTSSIHPKVSVESSNDGAYRPGEDAALDVAYARSVVTLYFHQILHGEASIIDLRAAALKPAGAPAPGSPCRLSWSPAPVYTAWEPDFRDALKQMYRGFYQADDERFRAGLAVLGLTAAEPLFRRHFGESPERTRFELRSFIDSFHAIFVFCKEHKIALHPNFVPLGIYLATMYENLDRMNVEVDAKACFFDADTGYTHSGQPQSGQKQATEFPTSERPEASHAG